MASRKVTLTGSQGYRPIGPVSGHVLKVLRVAGSSTQEQLAEALGVDTSTVQGWESGRRPLGATSAWELLHIGQYLARKCDSALVMQHLHEAMRADAVIAACIHSGGENVELGAHPLAGYVLRRSTTNLVTWPFTGLFPQHLSTLRSKYIGRGPVARSPILDHETQQRFFRHLAVVADRAQQSGYELLLRQAVYLLGFDGREFGAAWLKTFYGNDGPGIEDTYSGLHKHLASRSAAIALATSGDTDKLHRFTASLTDQRAELINLNYWAHWTGETRIDQVSDDFMLRDVKSEWRGTRLFEDLLCRLHEDAVQRPLILRSIHTLVSYKPELLARGTAKLYEPLADRLLQLESSSRITADERDRVVGLLYALRVLRA